MGGRVDVFAAMPLPAFSTDIAPAFAARTQGAAAGSPANMIAFVATGGLPVRDDALPTLLSYRHPALLQFRDSGQIDWNDGTGRRLSCLIYDRPPLSATNDLRLSTLYATPQKPLDDEKLVTVLRPIVIMLGDLDARGIGHGRLHPANIFTSTVNGAGSGLIIGDMASVPPAYDTPVAFLPIERAQAQPEARGLPRAADDLYSLGVLALLLKTGTLPPVFQLPPQELLQLRLERGTYSAYMGEHGMKGAASELLRGLLEDDVQRRWNIEALDMWFGGRKPGTTGQVKLAVEESKPRRPFTLTIGSEQKNSFTRRGAAALMTQHPLEAAAAIETGDFMRWVERAIESEPLTARAGKLLDARAAAIGTRPATLPDHLTARAIMLLDPAGPIRYRGLSLLPGGFGTLLAATLTRGGDVQPLADIMNARLPSLWTDGQSEHRADHLAITQGLERAQAYLDRPNPGFGIERVLYELVPGQPCLSPITAAAAPRTVKDLLLALDAIGSAGGSSPIDRHIAAFLVARDRRIHEGLLAALKPGDNTDQGQSRRAIGTLTLLAEAQFRQAGAQGQMPLKNLANWLIKLLEPGIKRYHHKDTQTMLRQKLAAAAAEGSLSDMLAAIDDPTTLDLDTNGYEEARLVWQQAEEDIAALQTDIDQRTEVEMRVGQPLASALAVVLGIVAGAFAVVFSTWTLP